MNILSLIGVYLLLWCGMIICLLFLAAGIVYAIPLIPIIFKEAEGWIVKRLADKLEWEEKENKRADHENLN